MNVIFIVKKMTEYMVSKKIINIYEISENIYSLINKVGRTEFYLT